MHTPQLLPFSRAILRHACHEKTDILPRRQRDSSSTASFEKTLSTLSVKIADSQSRLDRLRASSRRVKVLWTLYLAFAYTVYAIVLLLVVGYANLGALEWTALAGGPVVYDPSSSSPTLKLILLLPSSHDPLLAPSVRHAPANSTSLANPCPSPRVIASTSFAP